MKEQAAEQAKEIQDKLGLSSSVTRPDDAATSAAASGDINPSSTTDSSSHRHVGDSEEGGSSERSTSGTSSTEQNSKPKKKNRNDMIGMTCLIKIHCSWKQYLLQALPADAIILLSDTIS